MESIESLYRKTLEKYPCITYEIGRKNPLNCDLGIAIETYYIFHYGVEKKEHSFKFYPITVTQEEVQRLYNRCIKDIVVESIHSGKTIEELMSQKIGEYQKKIEENRQYALKTLMDPYYGDPNFMFERCSYIVECIQKLSVEIPNLEELYLRLQAFMSKYGNRKGDFEKIIFPYYTEEFRKDYVEFEKDYCSLLQIEKSLSKVIERIWKCTLTDPTKHDDSNFVYLIHTFTSGMIPLENMGKVCCSLATPKLLTPPLGDTGIICDFDSEAVEIMCSDDIGSWLITKRDFIDNVFPTKWQLPNPEGISVWMEYPQVSKLILPTDLEKEAIDRNVKYNGEILNYSKFLGYSEIFLNDKAKVIGAFYTDECQDTTTIQAYAKKYNLPLVHLSLQKLRENAGLSVFPEPKL